MSKKVTSKNAKANFSRYQSEDRAMVNKRARAARHTKLHPNDTAASGRGGRTQDMENRPTQLEARIDRAVAHMALFGQKDTVSGRDLSTASARKAIVNKKAA